MDIPLGVRGTNPLRAHTFTSSANIVTQIGIVTAVRSTDRYRLKDLYVRKQSDN